MFTQVLIPIDSSEGIADVREKALAAQEALYEAFVHPSQAAVSKCARAINEAWQARVQLLVDLLCSGVRRDEAERLALSLGYRDAEALLD